MPRQRISGLFVVAVFVAGLAGTAQGACPNNLADCLGSAAVFDVVADKLNMYRGNICDDGCGPVPSLTRDACASKAVVGGPTPALSGIDQLSNLIAAAEKVCGDENSRKTPATTWLRRRSPALSL